MTMIRYSDADRERMRQEHEARGRAYRREAVFHEFLLATGRMGIADRRPVSPEWIERIGGLDLRWRDRE